MPDMADIIDPPDRVRGRPHGRPSRYPWQEWTDGQWRLAKRGEDYVCKDASFQYLVYQQGYRRGMSGQALVCEDGVKFRFIRKKGGSK